MRFGVCTRVEHGEALKHIGWDFVEELIQPFLMGESPDDAWTGLTRLKNCPLPLPAANAMLPPHLKPVGPDVDWDKLQTYMTRVLSRAQKTGIKILVFGSGVARTVPDGFDRNEAKKQILQFIRMSANLAAQHNVVIVAEHLNRGECNIINSLDEAMEYVLEVNHPNYLCLVDSFHFWLEKESLGSLKRCMPYIRHVHVSDTQGRVPPGESGLHDYRPFFKIIKEAGYDGLISVEATGFMGTEDSSPRVLEYLRNSWKDA